VRAPLPPDVRKGFAFPTEESNMISEATPRACEIGGVASENKWSDAGKAEPFRTSSGKAAQEFHEECSNGVRSSPETRLAE
jgi:hypothetical protein